MKKTVVVVGITGLSAELLGTTILLGSGLQVPSHEPEQWLVVLAPLTKSGEAINAGGIP